MYTVVVNGLACLGDGCSCLPRIDGMQIPSLGRGTVNAMDLREINLRTAYERTRKENGYPARAHVPEVPASIPFVGREYSSGSGLLVYASTENLAGYRKCFTGTVVETNPGNRHRADFEGWKRDRVGAFPSVHISPVTQGGLFVAAAFVEYLREHEIPEAKEEFAETVAFGNFYKYAVESGATNFDPAGDLTWTYETLPFVINDLAILGPAVLLLPRSAWPTGGRRQQAQLLRDRVHESACPLLAETRVVFMRQCNQRSFNAAKGSRNGARWKQAGSELRRVVGGDPKAGSWVAWIADVQGVNHDDLWSFLAEIKSDFEASKPGVCGH